MLLGDLMMSVAAALSFVMFIAAPWMGTVARHANLTLAAIDHLCIIISAV